MWNRIRREKKTVEVMIRLFCRQRHHTPRLCPDCTRLLHYAHTRLDRCRFGNDKPTCFNCAVHCYSREMGQKVREVMRYAGPRMLARHPVLALGHLIDGWRDRTNPNRAKTCETRQQDEAGHRDGQPAGQG